MRIIARYIHGSEDSTDLDVYYVVDKLPEFSECRKFCSENTEENRNLIVIENGIVVDCFIGTVDEINNGLIVTYSLHEQTYPLLITKPVERNLPIKCIRATRGILSILSHTQYREEIKKALKGNWKQRLNTLSNIDFSTIDFDFLDKKNDGTHFKKVIAFQIGQTLALIRGIEVYTKSSIAETFELLKPYLYREAVDTLNLNRMKWLFCMYLLNLRVEETGSDIVKFLDYDVSYELRHEKRI